MFVDRQTLKLLKVASTDQSRVALQAVHFTPDYAEATDGCILARIPHPSGAPPEEVPANWQPMASEAPTDQLIHADSLAALGQALSKKGKRWGPPILSLAAVGRATEGGPYVGVAGLPTEERRIALEAVDATYPNTASVWPKGEVKFQVAISARLLRVLAELGENDAGTPVVLSFHDLDEPYAAIEFAIDGGRDKRPITGLVMPMRLPEPPSPTEPEPEGTEPQDLAEEPEELLEGEPAGGDA